GTGVLEQRPGDLEEGLPWATGDALDHLRRVAAEVSLDDLEDAARVVERLVPFRRRLQQRLHEVVVRGPARGWRASRRAAARRRRRLPLLGRSAGARRVPRRLAGLSGRGDPALVADAGPRVLPAARLVLADEAVVRPFLDAAVVLEQPREDAAVVLGVPVRVADDRGRVAIVDQPRLKERVAVPARVVDDVVNNTA